MKLDVAYIRYSDHKQDDGFSIEYQTTEVQDFAEKNGIDVDTYYIDKAQTATKVAGREEFFALINDVKAGKIKSIIVYKLSRIFRNALESAKFRELFRKTGVKLMSVTESVDEETSSGRFQTNIMASVDQYHSETISDHVKSSMREMARQGYYTGGTVKYGFALKNIPNGIKLRKSYIPHPTEAPVVRRIFKMYASGMSFPMIRDILNDENIKTKKGGLWYVSILQKIIEDDMYMGVYRFKTQGYDEIVVDGKIPVIVDKMLWITANDVKAKKQSKRPPESRFGKALYALTGKVFCEKCGSYMTGNSHTAKRNGIFTKYLYYGCVNSRRYKTCTAKMCSKDQLETETLNAIKNQILNDEKINQIADMVIKSLKNSPQEIDGKIKLKTAEKKQAEMKINNLLEALAVGKSDYGMKMISDLEKGIKKLDKELYVLRERKKSQMTREKIVDYMNDMLKKCNSGNEKIVKSIFDTFVDKIVVSDNEINITLNLFAVASGDVPKKAYDFKVYKV